MPLVLCVFFCSFFCTHVMSSFRKFLYVDHHNMKFAMQDLLLQQLRKKDVLVLLLSGVWVGGQKMELLVLRMHLFTWLLQELASLRSSFGKLSEALHLLSLWFLALELSLKTGELVKVCYCAVWWLYCSWFSFSSNYHWKLGYIQDLVWTKRFGPAWIRPQSSVMSRELTKLKLNLRKLFTIYEILRWTVNFFYSGTLFVCDDWWDRTTK